MKLRIVLSELAKAGASLRLAQSEMGGGATVDEVAEQIEFLAATFPTARDTDGLLQFVGAKFAEAPAGLKALTDEWLDLLRRTFAKAAEKLPETRNGWVSLHGLTAQWEGSLPGATHGPRLLAVVPVDGLPAGHPLAKRPELRVRDRVVLTERALQPGMNENGSPKLPSFARLDRLRDLAANIRQYERAVA